MQDLAFSMTPDQRISLYTTPNRLSLKVMKGLDLPISDVCARGCLVCQSVMFEQDFTRSKTPGV
ncbi:hypothetical protein HanPSC8_Chr15g0682281 [Helianthus annuus]|nr:hypothetical protein HanPSC8_Chr15g0682281 [Helianthus annuus]